MNRPALKVQQSEIIRRLVKASRQIRRGVRPYITGYRALLKTLRGEGFRVRWTCMAVPVQLEGHLPTGESFYFRCRNETCSLSIGRRRGDAVRSPVWRGEISRWDRFEAGMLDAEEAESVFRELLAQYASEFKGSPTSK